MVARKGFSGEVDGSSKRYNIARAQAVCVMGAEPVAFAVGWAWTRTRRIGVVGIEVKAIVFVVVVVVSCYVSVDRGWLGWIIFVARSCLKAALVQDRLRDKIVVKDLCDLDWAKDVGRIAALDKGGRKEDMVAVAVGQEDVLRALIVNDQASVEKQI